MKVNGKKIIKLSHKNHVSLRVLLDTFVSGKRLVQLGR